MDNLIPEKLEKKKMEGPLCNFLVVLFENLGTIVVIWDFYEIYMSINNLDPYFLLIGKLEIRYGDT